MKVQHWGKRSNGQDLWSFRCPGCTAHFKFPHYHAFAVGEGSPRWDWNGDTDRPTFSPSLLMNPNTPSHRCHLYVTDGKIHYCTDSVHALAGKTVDMEDWEESADP